MRSEETFRVSLFALTPLRLGGREDVLLVLAADDAVGAVIELGRRTGRVGDFGRIFGWFGDACFEPGLETISLVDKARLSWVTGLEDERPDLLGVLTRESSREFRSSGGRWRFWALGERAFRNLAVWFLWDHYIRGTRRRCLGIRRIRFGRL
ncbi:hypothetical protein CPSG_07487 [Coccidioides posadasii str. Silveira]|uniref:Uncharacterized protein n=1 Tax=Coccidioides posadasii (strain RMSCC 757 / Silveira) TaxID=443226 RepID=E9DCD5_COCPS|nr:hypothetical protein CPSG_07487 [Coccidioides posadasii str. Silveira]